MKVERTPGASVVVASTLLSGSPASIMEEISPTVFSPFFILFLRHLHSSQSPLGNSFLLEKASFPLLPMGVNPGAEGRYPRFWAGGSQGRSQGRSLESWTGREILLYVIMYRKYVRKWLILKRNRI